MDRRGFLKATAAVPLAALPLPAIVEARPVLTATMIQNAIADAWALAPNPGYYAIVHPAWMAIIRRYRAIEAWRSEYRKWRIEPNGESMRDLMLRVKAELEQKHEWTVEAV